MPDSAPPAGPALLREAVAALDATGRTPLLAPAPGLIEVAGHGALTSGEVVALAFRLGLMVAHDQRQAS